MFLVEEYELPGLRFVEHPFGLLDPFLLLFDILCPSASTDRSRGVWVDIVFIIVFPPSTRFATSLLRAFETSSLHD